MRRLMSIGTAVIMCLSITACANRNNTTNNTGNRNAALNNGAVTPITQRYTAPNSSTQIGRYNNGVYTGEGIRNNGGNETAIVTIRNGLIDNVELVSVDMSGAVRENGITGTAKNNTNVAATPTPGTTPAATPGTGANRTGTFTNNTNPNGNNTSVDINGTGYRTNNAGTNNAGVGTGTNNTGVGMNGTGFGANNTGTGINGTGLGTNNTGTGINGTGFGTNNTGTAVNDTGIARNNTGTGAGINNNGTITNNTGINNTGTTTNRTTGNNTGTITNRTGGNTGDVVTSSLEEAKKQLINNVIYQQDANVNIPTDVHTKATVDNWKAAIQKALDKASK